MAALFAEPSDEPSPTAGHQVPPWPAGAATGVGSMPGDDLVEATRTVLGELDGLPHLPELPSRGPVAGMVGRTGALLVDLPLELRPAGWRLASRPGSDVRQAGALLTSDLDLFAGLADGWTGVVKVQVTGPWTMAAAVETPRGGRVLTDRGAVADLVASLAEGVATHVSDVRRRLPGASVVVQVDEPGLPAVLAGSVPTVSGLGRLPSVGEPEAGDALGRVVAAAGGPAVVHCCAAGAPVAVVRAAGARALSFDLSLPFHGDIDTLADAVETGMVVFAGIVPATDSEMSDRAGTVSGVRSWWRRLGLSAEGIGERVVPTPACGLAGASPTYARAALSRCREVGRVLADGPDGE